MSKKKKKEPVIDCYTILEDNISFSEFRERVERERILKGKKNLSKRKYFWLYLIDNNLLQCPATGIMVDHVSYDQHYREKSYHYNFRSKDNQLFTIDHKIPKSKGGPDTVKNIQPMIALINFDKQDQLIYL